MASDLEPAPSEVLSNIVRHVLDSNPERKDPEVVNRFRSTHGRIQLERSETQSQAEAFEVEVNNLERLEKQLAQTQSEHQRTEKDLANLGNALGNAAFDACVGGTIEKHSALSECMAVHETLESLRRKYESLSPAPNAMWLEKAKAKANQLLVAGKIKLKEPALPKSKTAAGKQLIASGQEEAVRCDHNSDVLDQIIVARASVAERQKQVEQADATLKAGLQGARDTFGLKTLDSSSALQREIHRCKDEQQEQNKELSAAQLELGRSLLTVDLTHDSTLSSLVEDYRQTREGTSSERSEALMQRMTLLTSTTRVMPVMDAPFAAADTKSAVSHARFLACRSSVSCAGMSADDLRMLVAFVPCEDGDDANVHCFLAMTLDRLAVIPPLEDDDADSDLPNATLEEATWTMEAAAETNGDSFRRLAVGVEGGEPIGLEVLSGDSLDAVRHITSETFLARAEKLVLRKRYTHSEVLLGRIEEGEESFSRARDLLKHMNVLAKCEVTYNGGHSEMDDGTVGILAMDSAGIEFTPQPFQESNYLRLEYDQLLAFGNKKGELPKAYLEGVENKAAVGNMLGFAVGATAMLLDVPGGRQLGRAAGSVAGGSKRAGPRVQNRISLLARIDGEKCRLAFDANADEKEAMQEAAETFVGNARELLEQRGLKKSATGGSKGSSKPATSDQKKIVGCPKCQAKLRVTNAGVIGCPKCGTKIRVAEAMFSD